MDNVWPELLAGEADTIDTLIARLNAATAESGLVFEKDALDIERPEDWGAVELVNTKDEWADGKIIDRTYVLDVWAAVSDRGSDWLGKVEQVFLEYGDLIWYRLAERGYLHDVKKSLWRWRVEIDMSRTPEDEEDDAVVFETVYKKGEEIYDAWFESLADASEIAAAFKAGKCVTVHLPVTEESHGVFPAECWLKMVGYMPRTERQDIQGEYWPEDFMFPCTSVKGDREGVLPQGWLSYITVDENGKLRFQIYID